MNECEEIPKTIIQSLKRARIILPGNCFGREIRYLTVL